MISKLLRTVFLVDLFQGLRVTFRNQDPKKSKPFDLKQQAPVQRYIYPVSLGWKPILSSTGPDFLLEAGAPRSLP